MSPDRIVIPMTIEAHEEGGYLAVCDDIQGCHADGDTIEEATENIAEVAEMIWELCMEENLPLPMLLEGYQPGSKVEARVIGE